MARAGSTFLIVTCMLGVVLSQPRLLSSCGVFFARAAFTYTVHPDFPLEKFAAGELGVLQPTYARSYLAVAYRYLLGTGFSAAEQQALVALWRARLVSAVEADAEDVTKIWLAARSTVPELGAASDISIFRARDQFSVYLNCPADAFKTAASTLRRLQERFGPESVAVRTWVQAQDIVFAKCADGAALTLPPATDPQLQADSAYQMAAAQFYSGNFDAAVEAFAAIATDTTSPWRPLAPYLAARALVRKATLGAEVGQVDREVLQQAQAYVLQILADSTQQAMHAAAQRLLHFIQFRAAPTLRLHALAQAVLKKDAPMTLQQDLTDYTLLLDTHLGEQANTAGRVSTTSAAWLKEDALSDWIVTFQATDQEALKHALAQWQQTSALPWLVAALSKMDASHTQAAPLVAAAAQIPPSSPAFASVAFHRARLLLHTGKHDEVRTYLDTILTQSTEALPVSAANFLRAVRMQVARHLDEFLTYAQRFPADLTYDEDGRERPPQLFGVTIADVPEPLRAAASQAHFDADATLLLNQAMPVSVRQEALRRPVLPAHLRRELALATWVEAALLEQGPIAHELAVVVAEQVPELKPYLEAYLAAAGKDAKKFAAVYLMLKHPGTRPRVDEGLGRQAALHEIDTFRDNWWCELTAQDPTAKANDQAGNALAQMMRAASALDFLSPAQKAAAQAEGQKLRALGTAPNYLVAQVLAWAKRAPDDPRVPEALHLAVRSTRYGCTDTKTTQFSKQAFQLLHKQYPHSSWAKQTKYWY